MAISRKGNVARVPAPANLSYAMSFRASVEKSPTIETKTTVHEYQNTRPRRLTAGHDVISSVSREIPCISNENNRTPIAQILARGGSALKPFPSRKGVTIAGVANRTTDGGVQRRKYIIAKPSPQPVAISRNGEFNKLRYRYTRAIPAFSF